MLSSLRRSRWTPVGLVVLLGALLVFEALQLDLGGRRDAEPRPAPQAVGLARRFAIAFTSYDHKRLDADVARVIALGTPGFETRFRKTVGQDFTAGIAANKTISVGSVVAGPRVDRIVKGVATFVVVVDQQVTSEGGQERPKVIRVGMLVSVDQKALRVSHTERLV